MFQWDIDSAPRKGLASSVAASVLVHAVVIGAIFGLFVYRTASRFGMFELDDDPTYTNRVRVARVDTSKPLVLPPGFYSVREVKPIEEKRPEPEKKAEKPPEKPKREPEPEKKDEEPAEKGAEDGDTAKTDDAKDAEPAPPASGTPQFGKIKENALKPHLRAVMAAYEEGKIPDTPFRVTVTCRVQPDGSLTNIKLVNSSGNGMVDETALNLFRELSEMRALQPLAVLSSLSLTLERGESTSTLSAVGFATDQAQAETLKLQLDTIKALASFRAANSDQTALVKQTVVTQSGNRLAVSTSMPNSRAGDMMRRSFGSQSGATASKPSA